MTTLWYTTRGTGVVALLLLTSVVVLGVLGSVRWSGRAWPRFLVVGLHRNLTLLALAFLAVHILTSVADSFAPIGLKDAVLPFTSAYRPIWLGLGTVAFDLLLALTITSLLRARIGYRPWRALHWLAYASWPFALVHALGTGSDARVSWMQLLAAAATLAVVAAVFARLARTQGLGARVGFGAAALLLPVAALVWYSSGPGKRGWAARAGTPTSLLAPRVAIRSELVRRVVRVAAPGTQPLPSPPFRARLSGTLHESAPDPNGLVLVDIRAHTSGGADGVLRIRLQGQPTSDGGVTMDASGASYGPPSAPDAFIGKIVQLNGTQLDLALRGRTSRLAVHIALRIDGRTGTVSGVLSAAPGGAPSE